MYKKIVVGYDGSDRALKALEEAADLAMSLAASLHMVNAVAKDEVHAFGESSDRIYLSDTEIAGKRLSSIAKNYRDLEVTVKSLSGAPAKVLLSEAERVNADLIIVGNRNVQGLTRVLGSIAESVAAKANCAVLIVKTG